MLRSTTTLLLALSLTPAAAAAQEPDEPAGKSLLEALAGSRRVEELPAGYAAVGRGTLLTFEDLDHTLVRRHAMSQTGREALVQLVHLAVLDHLARERGIEISPAEMASAWDEVDEKIQSALGVDLAEYLSSQEISVAEFRHTLRLGLVHRRLTAEALGLPAGRVPTDEEQRIWLDQTIEERGLEEVRPPFDEGVAARCGDGVEISAAEYVEALREFVSPDVVDEAAFHLLLEQRLLARLPALSDTQAEGHVAWAVRLEAAIDAELEKRRVEYRANPLYHGVEYEALLAAQGFLVEDLRNDPMIRVAALTSAIVDANHNPAEMKAEYERRRDWYEGRHGEAVRSRYLLLRAAVFTNELQDRTFERAREELEAMKPTLTDEQRFAEAAARQTEDVLTRTAGGDLGWVHREEPRVLPELREAVFAAAAARPLPAGGHVAGPVDLPEGAALLWIAEARPSPGWGEEMRGHVRQELRREIVEETLLPNQVTTFLEAPPGTAGKPEEAGGRR